MRDLKEDRSNITHKNHRNKTPQKILPNSHLKRKITKSLKIALKIGKKKKAREYKIEHEFDF